MANTTHIDLTAAGPSLGGSLPVAAPVFILGLFLLPVILLALFGLLLG